MQRVLVTGASGFIGRALCDHLLSMGYLVRGIVRHVCDTASAVEYIECNLDQPENMMAFCDSVDCVIHLAGRAHIIDERESNPLELYRKINCEATLHLARKAVALGVRRFVFISSIGVNGSQIVEEPFNESSVASPHADYARSKYEAEQGLKAICADTKTELVIVRPPIVYSGEAPGNFRRLMQLVATGIPLPFASIKNLRSMVALVNFVDFVTCCIEHPAAANQLFLISDGIDVSTPQIIRRLAEGMGHKARLFSVHPAFVKRILGMAGKESMFTQLWGSLVVDSSKSKVLLGWEPKVRTDEALVDAGKCYKAAFG